jgi:hypothetical protein
MMTVKQDLRSARSHITASRDRRLAVSDQHRLARAGLTLNNDPIDSMQPILLKVHH